MNASRIDSTHSASHPTDVADRQSGLSRPGIKQPILITGGAGFIGTNLAARLASEGHRVRIFDSLARPGVERNVEWLTARHGDRIEVQVADLRNARAVELAISEAACVFHLAAQVAVTTSLQRPDEDFQVNLQGTFQLLDMLRRQASPPPLLFTSTNKVYGRLRGIDIDEGPSRYVASDPRVRAHGISESQPLDFLSPYGCSKGAADQYVLDFARCYRLPAVVFRMSCIYGTHQCGTEDQGWVAHFLLRVLEGQPITLFGDGKQVRDILWVDDLVDAMLLAIDHLDLTSGHAFNIGGGPRRTTSLFELITSIEEMTQRPATVERAPWRQGDQRFYVSDVRKLSQRTGWTPTTSIADGMARLGQWLQNRKNHLSTPHRPRATPPRQTTPTP